MTKGLCIVCGCGSLEVALEESSCTISLTIETGHIKLYN